MMTARRVIGVDPGGRESGIVVVDGDDVEAVCLVVREEGERIEEYALRAAREVERLRCQEPALVAVEGLRPPTPHLGMIALGGLLGAALVLGAVLELCRLRGWAAVVVEPGRWGSGPRRAYPPALWGSRERSGRGRRRHLRSAYDIALASREQARLEGVGVSEPCPEIPPA